MNYRHAFHAGNHADVVKHALLSTALSLLTAKPKPLTFIDAFSGAGRYDLALDDRAERTGEWRRGVGLLAAGAPIAALAPYLDVVRAENDGGSKDGALRFYPGSPRLAQRMIRPDDKLLAVERHPEEAESLRRILAGDRRARVYEEDGWAALASFLPPTPRRGLVLIDPPFEAPDEFARMLKAIRDGLRRWATGVFMLWHPVKDLAAVAAYERGAREAAGATPALLCELLVRRRESGGLVGSGVLILNPPYGLAERADAFGPALAERLGEDGGGSWRAEWLTPPR